MRTKHALQPAFFDTLEDRLVLNQGAAAVVAHVHIMATHHVHHHAVRHHVRVAHHHVARPHAANAGPSTADRFNLAAALNGTLGASGAGPQFIAGTGATSGTTGTMTGTTGTGSAVTGTSAAVATPALVSPFTTTGLAGLAPTTVSLGLGGPGDLGTGFSGFNGTGSAGAGFGNTGNFGPGIGGFTLGPGTAGVGSPATAAVFNTAANSPAAVFGNGLFFTGGSNGVGQSFLQSLGTVTAVNPTVPSGTGLSFNAASPFGVGTTGAFGNSGNVLATNFAGATAFGFSPVFGTVPTGLMGLTGFV